MDCLVLNAFLIPLSAENVLKMGFLWISSFMIKTTGN